ncbi:hypothetical protein [Allofranklinella schreckenbergeri]|uniref:hypothetical protein n=1 Tax=Allofranklinella schreckenbergeri TaxID=1076744 RepID=UPI0011C3C9A9|nr:hypothetical protein [Allofranklinella schreckenbergeri]
MGLYEGVEVGVRWRAHHVLEGQHSSGLDTGAGKGFQWKGAGKRGKGLVSAIFYKSKGNKINLFWHDGIEVIFTLIECV